MATGPNDLQLALLIKANADQAKAQLGQLQAQLKGVEASATSAGAGAAAGVQQLTDASTAASAAVAGTAEGMAASAAATEQVGETAEQAAARIHAMVQASLAAQQSALSRSSVEAAAAKATEATGAAAAAQGKSWRDLAAAQTAAMQRYTDARAPVLELQTLLQKSTLTTAEVAKAEQLLDTAQAAGIISAGELAEAFAALDAAKIKDIAVTKAQAAANKEAGLAGSLNYRSRREVGTIAAEALSGNFGRVRTSGLALANDMGLFTKLLSPMGLAIGGVVASLGALSLAFVKGAEEDAKFNAAIQTTGGYAGVTVGQLHGMAVGMTSLSTTTGQAKTALLAVVSSGKFAGDQIRAIAQAAVDMANTTGTSVGEAVKAFEQLGQSPVEAAAKLNEQYHFLTASVYDQIRALDAQGRSDEAAALAQSTLAQHFADAARSQEANLGLLQREWGALKETASQAWDAILGFGRKDTANAHLGRLQEDLNGLAQNGLVRYDATRGVNSYVLTQAGKHADVGSGDLQREINEYNAVRLAADAANKAAADKSTAEKVQANAVAAAQKLDAEGRGFDKAADRAKAYAEVVAQLDARRKAGAALPSGVTFADGKYSGKGFDYRVDKLAGISEARGPKGPDLGALQTNANVQAIQQALATLQNAWQNTQKVLDAQHRAGQLSDQQYFDTLRNDLDQYTQQRIAALEQEKTAAQAHIKTAADRIRADQKVQQIDAEITQTQQDSAAKRAQIDAREQKAIDDTKKAWLELEASLGVPVDVNTSKAMKKLAELYALVQKLKDAGQAPDAGTVNSMIGAALSTGVDKTPPRMRSARLLPDAANRDNPLAMVSADQQQLQAWYDTQNAQLRENNIAAQNQYKGNNEKLLQIQKEYQEQSAALTQTYVQQKQQLDKAKYWGELDMAQNVLGQLAELSRSHNAKIAALGKAAAIANALITTYKNATVAYGEGLEAGGPYAGPALGAVYAAVAVAAGLANVAAIRSQQTSGYATGGYTGAGAVHQVAGVVHAGEVVYSQADVARHGGVAAVEAHRLRGYADGGFVHPMANAPTPAQLGFAAPGIPRVRLPGSAANDDAHARGNAPVVHVFAVFDPKELADKVMNSGPGHKVIVNVAGDNPRAIQAKWGS